MALSDLRTRLCTRRNSFVERMFSVGPMALLRSCFCNWQASLVALQEENRILAELEAHRKGRGQLIQQYRELEAEYAAECRRGQELRVRCEDLHRTGTHLREQLEAAVAQYGVRTKEAEEHAARAGFLEAQLQEQQERESGLRRDLKECAERARRLELQAQQGEEERKELQDAVLRAQRSCETAREEAAASREADLLSFRAQLRERDDCCAVLQEKLQEARACLEALTQGANAFLSGSGRRAVAMSSSIDSAVGRKAPPTLDSLSTLRSGSSVASTSTGGSSGRRSFSPQPSQLAVRRPLCD